MPSLSTRPSRSAGPRYAPAASNVPLSANNAAAAFIDGTAEDVRLLTLEIDTVMSGRPPIRRLHTSLQEAASKDRRVQSDGADWQPGHDDFSWTPRDRRRVMAAYQAADWLLRAKRERRFARVRSAISWVLSLSFAMVIVGLAGFIVQGGLSGAANLDSAMRALGL
jgi:hypothetical protein